MVSRSHISIFSFWPHTYTVLHPMLQVFVVFGFGSFPYAGSGDGHCAQCASYVPRFHFVQVHFRFVNGILTCFPPPLGRFACVRVVPPSARLSAGRGFLLFCLPLLFLSFSFLIGIAPRLAICSEHMWVTICGSRRIAILSSTSDNWISYRCLRKSYLSGCANSAKEGLDLWRGSGAYYAPGRERDTNDGGDRKHHEPNDDPCG